MKTELVKLYFKLKKELDEANGNEKNMRENIINECRQRYKEIQTGNEAVSKELFKQTDVILGFNRNKNIPQWKAIAYQIITESIYKYLKEDIDEMKKLIKKEKLKKIAKDILNF
jgi:hypothetical protein